MPNSGTTWYDLLAPMITDVNPFVYSHPLEPEDVIDRDEETKQLLAHAVGGHFVRLFAPRKYGKTSLLRRVLRDAEREEGMIPILVDLYGVLSVADVTVRLERAYARQLKGKLRARIEEFLQSTGLGPVARRARGERAAAARAAARSAAGSARAARPAAPARGGRRLPGADRPRRVPGHREGARRWTRSSGATSSSRARSRRSSSPAPSRASCASSSRRRTRPLYGQAVPMRLGRLDDRDIAEYVAARFKETGRNVGEALNPLLTAAQGHPQRAMLLAHRLWDEVEAGETGDARRLDARPRRGPGRAAARVRRPLAAAVDERAEDPSRRRRRERALRSSDRVLEELDLKKSTARAALQSLVASADVEIRRRRLRARRPALRGVDRRLPREPVRGAGRRRNLFLTGERVFV